MVLGNKDIGRFRSQGNPAYPDEAGPGVRHVTGGKEGLQGQEGEHRYGGREESVERLGSPGPSMSEVGLVLLELHHEMVDVDELCPGRESSELGLRQHPVEAMIELD